MLAGAPNLTPVLVPFLLGMCVGFATAVAGLHRWFARSSQPAGRNILTEFRRTGIQYLVIGILLAGAAGIIVADYLPGHNRFEIVKCALWGLPVGLFAGVRWVAQRGER